MRQAELAAAREIQLISADYRKTGWEQAIGSSGTARALAELIEENGFHDAGVSHGISRGGLMRLKQALVKAGNVNRAKLAALKPDRVPVLPGGLAIMLAVFNELKIDYADTTDAALRLGVMYDLIGRAQHEDMRIATVTSFMRRYHVDRAQAARIGKLAVSLYDQLDDASREEHRMENRKVLDWAAALHEIGLSISHSAYRKHSAYIISNADMPGFSRTDQARLAALVLGHVGKLGKLSQSQMNEMEWPLLFCLRLAALLCRRRSDKGLPKIRITRRKNGYEVHLPGKWVANHPLTDYNLTQEAQEWERVGVAYRVVYAQE
jgi:exopolyphosphatase/guanosine-5'-triphosphate,3'-diphosphate pyrophosphatase